MSIELFFVIAVLAMADIIIIIFALNQINYYEEVPGGRQATKEEIDSLLEDESFMESERPFYFDNSAN